VQQSWLRWKLSRGGARIRERAKTLVPADEQLPDDSCMVCGRTMRPHRRVRGEGRVCSPTCARSWAEGLQ
jgi:hypothetical protein